MSAATIIEDQRRYVSDLVDQNKEFLEDAANRMGSIGFVIPNYFPAVLPEAPPLEIDITAPVLQPVEFELPPEPEGIVAFQDIPALDPGVAPTLLAVAPTMNMPTRPSQVADFTDPAPDVNTSYVVPSPPDELMDPFALAPNMPERAAPAKPTVALPSFDAVKPDGLPDAPTNLEGRMDAAYRDNLPVAISQLEGYVDSMLAKHDPAYFARMEKIEAKLNALLAGGTGFNPAVENALYERSQGKNLAEARRVGKAAMRAAADAGFTMPPGAALSAQRQARQAAADNNARANTDIVVLQAEVEQKNLQFIVTTTIGLRTAMLNAAQSHLQSLIGINGQALDYAKSVVSLSVETYNTAVRAFSAKLEAYRAEAAVYDTRVRAAMAEMELYRAEIQALEALTNVDRAKVDIYKARIDVLQVQANIYKARIDAVLGQASLEKLKIDLFQAKVQAHTARVQAKNSEWQGYVASVEGETSKVKAFGIQVDAFNGQMKGYETSINAKAKAIEAAALTNKARAEQYAAIQSNFRTIVEARGKLAEVKIEGQRLEVQAFQAQTQAAIGDAKVRSDYFQTGAQVAMENAKLRFNVQIKEGEYRLNFGNVLAQLAAAQAKSFSATTAAAAASMNTLAAETIQG
jgi:hypothetical protein